MIKMISAAALATILSLTSIPGLASEHGRYGYEMVSPAQPVADPGKIEVVELFWYGCPHCYRLEPTLNKWLKSKPADVEYVPIPAILTPQWELLARAFYVSQTLGILDKTHQPLFDAIHGERRRINSVKALAEFYAEFGVDAETFNKTYRSFAVQTRVRQAKKMTQRYGIKGVPAIIVNGKYRTSGQLAGTNRQMIEVVNRLIEQERKNR